MKLENRYSEVHETNDKLVIINISMYVGILVPYRRYSMTVSAPTVQFIFKAILHTLNKNFPNIRILISDSCLEDVGTYINQFNHSIKEFMVSSR